MNDSYPHFDWPFIQGLYNWQTLIGAGLALAAAIIGAILLWRQTQIAERHEEERRTRRFAAARATLPHILSEVVSYLEAAMEWMMPAHHEVRENNPLAEPPSFPLEVIGSLERMIEATSIDQVAKSCAEILSELQTFRARLESIARASRRQHRIRVGLDLELESEMLHAAEIHYGVGLLFPFARDEQDGVARDADGTSLFGSLMVLDCDEMAFKRVFERANELDKKRLAPSQDERSAISEPAPSAETSAGE